MHEAAERKNKEKILGECYKKERGNSTIKTKTKRLIPLLENNEFKRGPQPCIIKNNKLIARAYIMGRYGMLQCAANFSNGYGGKDCKKCKVEDNAMNNIE